MGPALKKSAHFVNACHEMAASVSDVTNKIISQKKSKSRPTDPIFFQHVTVNEHILFLGLIKIIQKN